MPSFPSIMYTVDGDRERDVPAGCRWLTRNLDRHHSYQPIDGIPSGDSDRLEMVDANATILE